MARPLGRWRMTDEIPFGARSGAFLTNPVDALARRVAARGSGTTPSVPLDVLHIHVHDVPTRRSKVHDQARRIRVRTRDAVSPTGGFPIAAGDTFTVGDCGDDGFSLRRIRTADTNPAGTPSPGDNVFGQESPPGTLDQLRRKIAVRQVNDRSAPDGGMGQLRDMQRYINRFYDEK